jgi:FeS assembly protein IscX
MPADKLTWTDIEDLAIELAERHPVRDPVAIRFTELRQLVEGLEEFEPEPGQRVNEQILEAIQAEWIEEAGERDERAEDEEDDEPGYRPANPFR